MKKHQAVPDDWDGHLSEEVVLHGDGPRELAGVDRLAGGPCDGVR